jgi:hypothetical protein
MDTGLLALTTFSLLAFSWLEIQLQDMWCDSVKAYISSLIIIMFTNIVITGGVIGLILGSSEALAVILTLAASMGFPLFSGIRKIPDISEKNNVMSQAQSMLEKNNNAGYSKNRRV